MHFNPGGRKRKYCKLSCDGGKALAAEREQWVSVHNALAAIGLTLHCVMRSNVPRTFYRVQVYGADDGGFVFVVSVLAWTTLLALAVLVRRRRSRGSRCRWWRLAQ